MLPPRARYRHYYAIASKAVLLLALDAPHESNVHRDELATIFPTKTPEYLASGRPVFAHCPSDYFLARFLNEHGCGAVVSEDDDNAIMAQLLGHGTNFINFLGYYAYAGGEDGITAEVAPQDDDLANPPQTMAQCLQQAQDATVAAIEDGQILMDVEFPPLAADLMDDPNTSAGEIAASRRLQE